MRPTIVLCAALAACSGGTGPQGPQGGQGPQGLTGATGAIGAAGPVGASADVVALDAGSAACPNGGASLATPDGGVLVVCNGASGPQGVQGLQGAQGVQGPKGDTGAQGLQGATGVQGTQGLQGLQGVQGLKGDKGDPGAQGIQGMQGVQGNDGTPVVASSEPAGGNCAAGGARFVVGATTTFACNGSNAPGYTAGPGLSLTGTQFSAAFTAAGGDNGVATTVARGDHLHDARYQPRLVTTLVVSPAGTPTQNGNVLRTTIGAITDASATKPYVIKVEPGVYDLGFNPYHGKPYVDLEGSGRISTVITGNPADVAVVEMVGPSEVRELSVSHRGSVVLTYAVSLLASASGPTAVRRVTASATTGTTATSAILLQGAGELIVEDSDATATSLLGTVSALDGSTATGQLTVRRSRGSGIGTTPTVTCYGLQSAAGTTLIEDAALSATGGVGAFAASLLTSPSATLRQVSAAATSTEAGALVVGLLVDTTTATVEGGALTASATGAGSTAEAFSATSAGWTVRGALLQASGPASRGVAFTSTAGAYVGRFDQCRIVASGGGLPLGLLAQPSAPSTLLVTVAGSQLGGGIATVPGATLHCVNDYDQSDAPLSCP